MAIFTEQATIDIIEAINEKRSIVKKAKDNFKKKYEFDPVKPGSNKGTLIVDGERQIVRFEPKEETAARTGNMQSEIVIGDDIFRLKGSHKGERRDAALKHEIGHQKLHNIHPQNISVDHRKRDEEVLKSARAAMKKNEINSNKTYKNDKELDDEIDKLYKSTIKASEEDKKERRKGLNAAKKYDNGGAHTQDVEFEADRYAANHTSERAVKKATREIYKYKRNEIKKDKSITKDGYKNAMKQSENDMRQRSKALKDDTLRNSKIYK